ncbi:hypothetical protein D3C87_1488530 [compost metagenome]
MRRLDTNVSCTAIMRDDGRRRRHQCAFEFSKLLHLLRRKFRFQRSRCVLKCFSLLCLFHCDAGQFLTGKTRL